MTTPISRSPSVTSPSWASKTGKKPDSAASLATRTVSAKDRLVIPGGIDPHIHCSMPVKAPGRPDEAVGLLRAALACHTGMATFQQAQVSEKDA